MSNWETEPRSNRYHYATRFSKELPVYFVQPSRGTHLFDEKIIGNFHLIKAATLEALTSFMRLLDSRNIKNPLLWAYNPICEPVINNFSNSTLIYHATENYFIDAPCMKVTEHLKASIIKLFPRIDLLVGVCDRVTESYKKNGFLGNTITVENGCDAEFYLNIKNNLNLTPSTEKIAIFQGGINSRLNFCLLEEVISLLPEWQFWFCGREDGSATHNPSWIKIKNLNNVKYFGPLSSYEELGKLMCHSSVGLIPFIEHEWVFSSLPLKAYEYVACGLPVVSTPIHSLDQKKGKYNLFQFATSVDKFIIEMQKAYETRYDKVYLKEREKAALENSYNIRFNELKNQLGALIK